MTVVTVALSPDAADDLERCSYAEALTASDVISRAIRIYAAIGAAEPGQTLTFTAYSGTWRQVAILTESGALPFPWPWRRKRP